MIGRRRTVGLTDRLAALDEAIALAEGRLPDESVNLGQQVADKVRQRLGHGTTHTLAALLGATGGGKSSLTNAVLGADIATTDVRRPTTSRTLACVWGPDDAQPLLDWLGVTDRHQVPGPSPALDGLVLLDVPDHDSVHQSNREEMERVAEHADLLIWASDPEKYGDEAMHAYLRQLHRHGRVTTLVLNKVDLLSSDELAQCRRDLTRLLELDGLSGVRVVATSATTGEGVDELVGVLAHAVNDRRAVLDRLQADIATAAGELLADFGPAGGLGTVPRRLVETLSVELVAASGLATVSDAVQAGHRRDALARTGWPFTRWARSLRPHPLRRLHLERGTAGRATLPKPSGVQRARTEGAVRTTIVLITETMPEPWPAIIRDAATPDQAELSDRLDQAVGQAVRSRNQRSPRWWAIANLVQLILALAVALGAIWLGLLAVGAYLQLPDVPTPGYRGIPVPTGLVVGGILLGPALAGIAGRVARIGASRRAMAVRKDAERAVERVASSLVVEPIETELERRGRLRAQLAAAGATAATTESRSEAMGR